MADSKKYNGSTWEHSLRKLNTSTDTLTTLPADIYADGNNATVGISGNTVQSGTPTPDNPIMPQGTGERTANLCPMIFSHKGVVNDNGSVSVQNTRLWTDMIPVSASSSYYVAINGKASNDEVLRFNRAIQYDASGTFISRIDIGASITTTFTTAANCAYIVLDIRTMSLNVDLSKTDVNSIQMNSGSTALPHEPYGYKIPISSANTTTPVYLGEVETTRKIKKYICTGDETVDKIGNNIYYLSGALINDAPILGASAICTHYENNPVTSGISANLLNGQFTINQVGIGNYSITIHDDINGGNVSAQYKRYLQQQYAAGTPVTVWYVLDKSETVMVNEPLMKIGDYADTVNGITIPTVIGKDTFDVDTALKPSEVSLSYTGWHDATVEEWDGSQWQ